MIGIIANNLRWYLGRVFVLYLVALAAVYFFLDYKAAKFHAYGATLSRLQPPYDYLTGYMDGKLAYERRQLLAYRLFFTRLVEVLPDRADGHAMLGYCQYQLGETDAALASFRKAADTVAPFMWFNYAAGYQYYLKKDYPMAVEYLSKAISANPEVVFKFIAASKPYLDAIATISDFQETFANRVKGGMKDSYKLLVLSYYHSQQYEPLLAAARSAIVQNLDDDGFFHYYLGVGAYYAGQFEVSIVHLQKSISMNPDASENYYYLGLGLKAMDKENLAVAAIQKAQELERSKGMRFSDLRNIRLRIM